MLALSPSTLHSLSQSSRCSTSVTAILLRVVKTLWPRSSVGRVFAPCTEAVNPLQPWVWLLHGPLCCMSHPRLSLPLSLSSLLPSYQIKCIKKNHKKFQFRAAANEYFHCRLSCQLFFSNTWSVVRSIKCEEMPKNLNQCLSKPEMTSSDVLFFVQNTKIFSFPVIEG